MAELTNEIKALKEKISKLEERRELPATEKEERIAITNEITAHVNEIGIIRQQIMQQGGAGSAKTIHIVVPPMEKDDEPTTENHVLKDQVQLDKLLCKHRASLFVGDDVCDCFDRLVHGGIYSYGGPLFYADANKWTSARVDSKMVEIGCGLAVQNEVRRIMGTDTTHVYFNHVEKDNEGNPLFEIDALIVDSIDASSPNATAYVVECATSPQLTMVTKLLATVEKLKTTAALHSSPFHHCTTFVPVLGGRYWSPETEDKCKANIPPIWRVRPSGALYDVRRTFSSSVLKRVRLFVRNI